MLNNVVIFHFNRQKLVCEQYATIYDTDEALEVKFNTLSQLSKKLLNLYL